MGAFACDNGAIPRETDPRSEHTQTVRDSVSSTTYSIQIQSPSSVTPPATHSERSAGFRRWNRIRHTIQHRDPRSVQDPCSPLVLPPETYS